MKTPKNPEDKVLDSLLRPKTWSDFIGQEKIKYSLKIMLDSAKKRQASCDHILFYGPSGVGKTTLAHLIAQELSGKMTRTSGPAIKKIGDMAALLTNLEDNEILFIDEIHRLNKQIEEVLYPAMESSRLNLMIGKGVSARNIELNLPRFTLVAATTRPSLLSSPLRNRFGSINHLDFYEDKEIKQIIRRSAEILKIRLDEKAVEVLAKASRATPRVANRILKRTWDLAIVRELPEITRAMAEESLKILNIDEFGLEWGDRKLLELIVKKYRGGPVGIQTISAALNEEKDTIEQVFEPYLLKIGFLERTNRGRVATKSALERFG
ncbi:MAG: Holliday junction DNA helicase RuvB, holliday junction DNA helicase RuvB [Parcubacteria group bacterium GW2011_GWC1_45_9]|nr:MAG: Holliday junction ATP-dependent DNA helicase RuvB [Parcubacteria group bacterium GW2011_GWA1_Parcubacteria_45_10]KKT88014.1 MAG: Holliday junction ATP-dependent DNA helicase RuvB [Parcubacteria group bacterium GW2011_GWB1_45_10]KKU17475.1 MAG: Holliday junction DNA helicase RuvB, holliday junction DNA helicase RuvB [Parcubacteria group bacterium GW2011_GWC1_45_9]HCI05343.1 Holliday junction branch migration DNA helicase RuvB [Patescibacteria group bacterium]